MIFSIGMIVKNEEKYLEKCLTALKPILENVDSELIIADTGSTDRTVEIAKKFTDNVFHFEWINDFAAARNSTLDRAQGEWYMFLDADEIIKDCTELIEFFNSGEYKKYGSASIVIRNYNDLAKMDLFNNISLKRLTALQNGVRFTKAIHEHFDRDILPCRNLTNTIADHYGYVYKDGDKILDTAKIKTSRNLELLFQELEEGKKGGYISEMTYGQIADCYIWLKDNENSLKYVELGMENCRPESLSMFEYYNKKLKTLGRMAEHEKVIEVCREYFGKDNLSRKGHDRFVTDSNVYFSWAASSYALGNYDEAINKIVLGMDVYRSYRSGKLFTPELNYCSVETTITMLKQICNLFISACIRQKRYSDAASQLPNIPLSDFLPDAAFMKSHLEIRTELMDKTNYNKLPDLYYQLDEPNRALYIKVLMCHIFKTERYEQFLKKLALIANGNERFIDVVKLYESYFIHYNLNPRQINEFIKKYGTKDNEAIWILMMKKDFDTTPFICAEDFDPEESVKGVYYGLVQSNAAQELFAKSVNWLPDTSVDKALDAFERAVYSATEFDFDITKVVRAFGKLGRRWADMHPNEELPERVDFALILNEIAELQRKKRYDESIAKLKELIGDDPADSAPADTETDETKTAVEDDVTDSFSETDKTEPASESSETENSPESGRIKVLRQYLKSVHIDKENSEDKKEKQSDPAMVALAEQIKQEIRALINAWDLDGAEEALNSMARMVPFDPDIEDIRDEIIDRKVNYMNYM